jgi:hypothetical protein
MIRLAHCYFAAPFSKCCFPWSANSLWVIWTLGGPVSQMAQDVDTIRRKGKEVGLQLNDKKCELISKAALPNNPTFENFI